MNLIAGYRKMLDKNQTDMASIFNISLQAYRMKEIGNTPFSDREKIMFKEMLLPIFPNITIDEIFFNQKVSKVERKEVNPWSYKLTQ